MTRSPKSHGDAGIDARDSRLLAFLIFAILLSVIFVSFHYRAWNFDDAFIVYRVAENLVSGAGWAYNIGEPHNPTTSVLNTLLIAGLSIASGWGVSTSAHILGGSGLFLAGIGVAGLLRRIGANVPLATLAGVLLVGFLAGNSTWGIETNLFIGAALAISLLPLQSRWHGLLLGLLVLIRPDGALFGALRFIAEWRERRAFPLWTLLSGALVVAPWLVFSFTHFGELFPNTLQAKVWQGQSGLWGHGPIYLKGLAKHLVQDWQVVTIALAGALGLLLSTPRLWIFAPFFVAALLQQAAYAWLNVPAYHWYLVSLDVVLFLGACLLAQRLLESRMPRPLMLLAIVAALVTQAWPLNSEPPIDMRDARYREAIQAIERESLPEGALAAVETGTVGYWTKRRILDLTGLTSNSGEFVSGTRNDEFFSQPPRVLLVHRPAWHFENAILDDVRLHLMFDGPYPAGRAESGMDYFVYRRELPAGSIERYLRETFPAVLPATDSAVIAGEALCVIDQLNGRPAPANAQFSLKRELLTLRGWSAATGEGAALPVSFAVLRGAGVEYRLPLTRANRPDVQAHLGGEPSFAESGIVGSAHLLDVPPGRYELVIREGREANAEGAVYQCAPAITLQIH